MLVKDESLHGYVPDKAAVALLLIDVINDLEFEEGDALLQYAVPMAERLAALKRRAKDAGIPAIYINDNFGRWQSDLRALIDHCLQDGIRGKEIVKRLQPDEDDYFVLKPKHSGFYSTTLVILLAHLRAKTLIVTGIAGNICVLFTANDAYMRDYSLIVPPDCVASNSAEENEHAVQQMQKLLKADITPSTELELSTVAEHTLSPRADQKGSGNGSAIKIVRQFAPEGR